MFTTRWVTYVFFWALHFNLAFARLSHPLGAQQQNHLGGISSPRLQAGPGQGRVQSRSQRWVTSWHVTRDAEIRDIRKHRGGVRRHGLEDGVASVLQFWWRPHLPPALHWGPGDGPGQWGLSIRARVSQSENTQGASSWHAERGRGIAGSQRHPGPQHGHSLEELFLIHLTTLLVTSLAWFNIALNHSQSFTCWPPSQCTKTQKETKVSDKTRDRLSQEIFYFNTLSISASMAYPAHPIYERNVLWLILLSNYLLS